MEVNCYIRQGDQVRKFEDLTDEEKKQISLQLNQQAARSVVLTPKTA